MRGLSALKMPAKGGKQRKKPDQRPAEKLGMDTGLRVRPSI